MSRIVATVALLVRSNIFMAAAWYGRLKFSERAAALNVTRLGQWARGSPGGTH